MEKTKIILAVLSVSFLAAGSIRAQEDPWAPLQFLVGSWVGEETGAAGAGKGDRVYEFIFEGKFLHARNTSRFPPQEKNPDGEVHMDWSFFSHDGLRDRIVLREFHIEGFVNQYILVPPEGDGNRLVFISESVENFPPGGRVRLTLTKIDENAFHEVFELAGPGEDFTVLLENRWTRKTERSG